MFPCRLDVSVALEPTIQNTEQLPLPATVLINRTLEALAVMRVDVI
jgi:hypothetical protein